MKKQYFKPEIKNIKSITENLLITASPGVGGDFDPNDEIGAKEDYFEELKEKYDKNIEKLENKLSKFKENKEKDVSKDEKEETKNKEDKEIDF